MKRILFFYIFWLWSTQSGYFVSMYDTWKKECVWYSVTSLLALSQYQNYDFGTWYLHKIPWYWYWNNPTRKSENARKNNKIDRIS